MSSVFDSGVCNNTPSPVDDSSAGARWQPCGARHVAVYGTLRAGGINDMARLRTGLRGVGRTQLTGSLYDLGWYPGLRLEGTQSVLAEVYELDDALEQQLDGIEGLWPVDLGEYTKRILTVPVALTGGGMREMAVLVYEALPATVGQAPQIEACDWLAWFERKGMQHPDTAFQLNTLQNRK
ncbi:gamma-glutamylcyclotransferase [Comamonas serinivorans]|uniref:Gamma-glutamylcyclotransferase n=1 Tax=Comamonas serinivorans TaxID=1082851 RepID=A0A1Y0EIH7_9BURK|nr:gamma-glutamylcyclotransferase family protein [Comamonas serinivorans]ARU03414.1 gamma-glutamylcyclotransferase [Comamonas serinivorans]